MKVNTTHALLGAALMALSTYGFAATTADQAGVRQVVITGDRLTDAQVRDEVRQRINERPQLRFDNIDVQSFDHNVYLYGVVYSRGDSEQAEAIAHTIPSARKIYNGISVGGAGG
jgi:osmotically-inducible protein OsmY